MRRLLLLLVIPVALCQITPVPKMDITPIPIDKTDPNVKGEIFNIVIGKWL